MPVIKRPRAAAPDAVCAAAVDLARSAAEDAAGPEAVGEHIEAVAEGERLVTHYFTSTSRGYRGWRWAVTLARAPRARAATVCETVLLPSADAIQAPAWTPWADRLAPGDVGPADQLPYRADDPYLVPGYTAADEAEADQLGSWELGLGRARVLSREGRQAAAHRWYTGAHGPTSEIAMNAPAACSTCGYFVLLSGELRQMFGVCANEWSPADGTVVSADFGCGAHSETDIEQPQPEPLPPPILDETGFEAIVVPRSAPPAEEPEPEASVSEAPEPEASEPEPESQGEPAAEGEPADEPKRGPDVDPQG